MQPIQFLVPCGHNCMLLAKTLLEVMVLLTITRPPQLSESQTNMTVMLQEQGQPCSTRSCWQYFRHCCPFPPSRMMLSS